LLVVSDLTEDLLYVRKVFLSVILTFLL